MDAVVILRQLLADAKKELYSDICDRYNLSSTDDVPQFLEQFTVSNENRDTFHDKGYLLGLEVALHKVESNNTSDEA